MKVSGCEFVDCLDVEHCATGGRCEDAITAALGRLPEVRVDSGGYYVAPDGEKFGDIESYFDHIDRPEGT